MEMALWILNDIYGINCGIHYPTIGLATLSPRFIIMYAYNMKRFAYAKLRRLCHCARAKGFITIGSEL